MTTPTTAQAQKKTDKVALVRFPGSRPRLLKEWTLSMICAGNAVKQEITKSRTTTHDHTLPPDPTSPPHARRTREGHRQLQRRAAVLGPMAALVYAALDSYADDYGGCWPSQRTLMRQTGICRRSVYRATRALVAAGILTVEQPGGQGRVHRYRIHYPEIVREHGPMGQHTTGPGDHAEQGHLATSPRMAPNRSRQPEVSPVRIYQQTSQSDHAASPRRPQRPELPEGFDVRAAYHSEGALRAAAQQLGIGPGLMLVARENAMHRATHSTAGLLARILADHRSGRREIDCDEYSGYVMQARMDDLRHGPLAVG